MIPRRVKLAGFLSYQDEQEIDFGSASLWMLAGSNGSGKSSVFDALTYALFGHHRGGSQNASELINKDCNNLAVELDFTLDGQLYRIKRTLRRNPKGGIAGTQQVFREVRDPAGNATWEAVPDTNKKVDFDRWIQDKIGLNYETFTSSVLLLQGKAEKLLDAKPSGRAEVLAGIVDLERYQRLYEKANARKLECKSRLEAISHQTDAVPEISDMELSAAILRIHEAEEQRETVAKQLDEMHNREVEARRWVDLTARLGAAQHRLKTAEFLLGEAARIQRDFARFQELREVLPAVHTVLTMRGQVQESQRKTDHYLKLRQEAQERRQQAEHERTTIQQQRQELLQQLAQDEQKLSQAGLRLRELTGLLEQARLADEQQAAIRSLDDELRRLPTDPRALVQAAQEQVDRLQELQRILPILERFQTERHDLRTAQQLEHDTALTLKKLQTEGVAAKAELTTLQQKWQLAQEERAAADQEVAISRTLCEQARAAMESLQGLRGAPSCSACGQPLTPQHFQQESKQRQSQLQLAESRLQAALLRQSQAHTLASDLLETSKKQAELVQRLREEYQATLSQNRQAASEIQRLTASLALRYAELPEATRRKIALTAATDWTQTDYPQRDELAQLRRDAASLEAARRSLREAQDVAARWADLRTRRDSAEQLLQRLQTTLAQADVAGLRQEAHKLGLQEKSLIQAIKTAKQSAADLEREADRHSRAAHDALQTMTELIGKLHTEEVVRKSSQDASSRALQNLPTNWQQAIERAGMAEYSGWQSELQELLSSGVEAQAKHLEMSRGNLAHLRREAETLQAEVDAVPPDLRLTPDEARQQVLATRQQLEQADKTLRDAQRDKSLLDGYREQRAKLGEQFRKLDAEHQRYKLLAELLGRDRLQRYLVRQAERQIVDYANAVLDRLSGGQLYLKLASSDDGSGADKALELECHNRTSGSAPINVLFLSGSQKFRVAVSLALAIGQYASKQHRPIESVIIDEGFGCLDRQGRQVMIQELQNLRGHLHCILLVSHQEEFAEAFSHGYRFELHNGATKVSRVER